MKFIKIILLTGVAIIALIGLIGVTSYIFRDNLPKLEIYKSGYNPGKNDYLQFNGFYDPYIDDVSYDKNALYDAFQPVFFFTDGSFCYHSFQRNSLNFFEDIENRVTQLIWGNYKIEGDTITMESLPYGMGVFQFKYRKIIHKGVISAGSINLYSMTKRSNYLPMRKLNFIYFSQKPDSTLNWIRNEEYYH